MLIAISERLYCWWICIFSVVVVVVVVVVLFVWLCIALTGGCACVVRAG